jgi:hypothetical protein
MFRVVDKEGEKEGEKNVAEGVVMHQKIPKAEWGEEVKQGLSLCELN